MTAAANLTQLAVRLGIMEEIQAQIGRNPAQWHAWLDRFNSTDGYQVREEDLYDPERDEFWFPPPGADGSDLPRRLLQVA